MPATRMRPSAALLFAELAATVKDRKQTVLEYLDDLFIDVGHHGDRLINKVLEGREGLGQNQPADGGVPNPAAPPARRLDDHRGPRLQDPRDPHA